MKRSLATIAVLTLATSAQAAVTVNGGRINETFTYPAGPLNGILADHANLGTHNSTGDLSGPFDVVAGNLDFGPQISIPTVDPNAGSVTRSVTTGFGESHTDLDGAFNNIAGNYKESWTSFNLNWTAGHVGFGFTDAPFVTHSAVPKLDQSGATIGDVPSEKEGFGLRVDSAGNLFAATWKGVNDNGTPLDQSDDTSNVQSSPTSLALTTGDNYKIFMQSVMGNNAGGDKEQITIWAVSEADMVDGLGDPQPVFLRNLPSVTVTTQIRNFDIKQAGSDLDEMFFSMFATQAPIIDNIKVGWLNGTDATNYPGTPLEADRDAARQQLIAERSFGAMFAFDSTLGSPYVAGDTQLDADLDSKDIDHLRSQIGLANTHSFFDLNTDLAVDLVDVDFLVQNIFSTDFGDVDLNGIIDATDEAVVTGNQGLFSGDATWADGDMTGDGFVDAADLAFFGGIVGDLNGDGFVGIADLNIVLGNWNLNVPPGDPLADPSGDGFVGIADLNVVLGNWNAGTPPADGAAVPEPATLALLGMGGLAMLRRRR